MLFCSVLPRVLFFGAVVAKNTRLESKIKPLIQAKLVQIGVLICSKSFLNFFCNLNKTHLKLFEFVGIIKAVPLLNRLRQIFLKRPNRIFYQLW
jgi:hypothetical protein